MAERKVTEEMTDGSALKKKKKAKTKLKLQTAFAGLSHCSHLPTPQHLQTSLDAPNLLRILQYSAKNLCGHVTRFKSGRHQHLHTLSHN